MAAPAKTSKEVTRKLSWVRFLLSALRTQGPEVARLSLAQVRPHLRPADREPDFHADLVGLARQLEGAGDDLGQADSNLYALSAELSARIRERRHGRQLARASSELRDLQRRIDEGQRRCDEALLRKRAALKEVERIYLRTARMFEELCRHAGKAELAERVRPSARRGTLRTEEATTDDGGGVRSAAASGRSGPRGPCAGRPVRTGRQSRGPARTRGPLPPPEPGVSVFAPRKAGQRPSGQATTGAGYLVFSRSSS